MTTGPVAAIVNPRSANGKTGRAWPRILSELQRAFGRVEALETRFPGHAIDLAAEAMRSGHRTVIAVGGDGTVNEVANGLLAGAAISEVVLGVVPQGTGSDFRRALGLPLDESAAIRALRDGGTRLIDAMKVAYHKMDGRPASRHAVNLVSFGMGGAVAARVNRTSKALGGKVSFLMATAATTFGFPGNTVSVSTDAGELRGLRISNVAIGNGGYHGGGMLACPRASIDDGLLEITIIEKMSAWEIFRDLAYLYNGKIYDHPKVRYYRTAGLEAHSEEAALLEIDGEPLGKLPVTVTALPGAIRVLVPPRV